MVEGFGEPFSAVAQVLGNLALVHFLSSASLSGTIIWRLVTLVLYKCKPVLLWIRVTGGCEPPGAGARNGLH